MLVDNNLKKALEKDTNIWPVKVRVDIMDETKNGGFFVINDVVILSLNQPFLPRFTNLTAELRNILKKKVNRRKQIRTIELIGFSDIYVLMIKAEAYEYDITKHPHGSSQIIFEKICNDETELFQALNFWDKKLKNN